MQYSPLCRHLTVPRTRLFLFIAALTFLIFPYFKCSYPRLLLLSSLFSGHQAQLPSCRVLTGVALAISFDIKSSWSSLSWWITTVIRGETLRVSGVKDGNKHVKDRTRETRLVASWARRAGIRTVELCVRRLSVSSYCAAPSSLRLFNGPSLEMTQTSRGRRFKKKKKKRWRSKKQTANSTITQLLQTRP